MAVTNELDAIKNLERLSGCQRVFILPHGFKARTPTTGIKWPTFGSLLTLPDFEAMMHAETTFEGFLQGHVGHPGGIPSLPGGHAAMFGVKDFHDTEWWLSEAEGLTGSAVWEQHVAESATTDGAWLLSAKGKGRTIRLKGTGVATSKANALLSLAEAASALSIQPRTGWCYWVDDDEIMRKIPVTMSSAMKVVWKSEVIFDIEIEAKGVNLGSAGAGVFMEGGTLWHDLDPVHDVNITAGGTIASPSKIEVYGPVPALGFRVAVDAFVVELAEDVPTHQTLLIDTATHSVTLTDTVAGTVTPARQMVRFFENRWPMMAPGSVHVQANWTRAANSLARVTLIATPLW
jgi:hypothetical protein